MADCKICNGPLTVTVSCFPGWDLLQCEPCERPIKLLPQKGPKLGGAKTRRGDLNRAMRAHRRMQMRKATANAPTS